MDQHSLSSSVANATSYLPSGSDLLLAVPRLLAKAGLVPDHIDSIWENLRSSGSVIAEPTANATNATVVSTASAFVQDPAAATAGAVAGDISTSTMLQSIKHMLSLFTYLTSKWAIGTFATAILLNRTFFYASSRVPLSFRRLYVRVVLYIVPTLLFLYRIHGLLRAMRCQTSPDWSQMNYGAPNRQLDFDFAGEDGFLFRMSSALLSRESLETSCRAMKMVPEAPDKFRPSGSLTLLWPLFISFMFSHFVETLACALQGVRPHQEVGMTIFEHSLAFAESEALITKPLVFDASDLYNNLPVFTPDGTKRSLTFSRNALSRFANVPPEVLLISLLSCMSHLTSHFLAMIGVRSKLRLVSTSIWGLAYMATFAWSFVKLSQPHADLSMARIPSVCIVGFVPHILIVLGICACGAIYLLAFILTVLSPPPGSPDNMSIKQRFSVAYANLHANIYVSSVAPLTISWSEDFYTVILKVGFTILTAASEAVYLNEGTKVNVDSMTWLEKKRLEELLARRRRFQQSLIGVPRELMGSNNAMGEGVEVFDGSDETGYAATSGYTRERKAARSTAPVNTDAARAVGRDSGIGFQQRRGRFRLTFQLLKGVGRLFMALTATMTITVLQKMRIPFGPRWLRRIAGPRSDERQARSSTPRTAVRSQYSARSVDRQSRDDPSDLEKYERERLRMNGFLEAKGAEETEQYLNARLYDWWKKGGNWGDVDSSGDYVPAPENDDTTSVVSFSTTGGEDDWSDISDGQRTPTQSNPSYSRESTPLPDNGIDLSRLSHLLDPQTNEDKEEARLLARRLQSPGIMTRSKFRQEVEQDNMRVLTSSRLPVPLSESTFMSPEEEEKTLERFILGRRSATTNAQGSSAAGTWDTGADGMGSEGPQCVVCQLSPRTVLVWPCGCLSLCDECRVGLASKNYTTCVCCRTNVVAYSRLYVP